MTYLIKYLPGDLVAVPSRDRASKGEYVPGIVTSITIYNLKKEPDYIVFTDECHHITSFNPWREAYHYTEINTAARLIERLVETPFSSICRDNLCTLKNIYRGCPEGCFYSELTSENDVYLPLDIVREIFTGTKYKVIGLGLSIWSGDIPGYYDSYKPISPWTHSYSNYFLNDLWDYLRGRKRENEYAEEDIDVERIWEYLKQDQKRYKLIYNLCNPKLNYLTSDSPMTWLPQNRLRLWKRSNDCYTFIRAGMMEDLCKRCIYWNTAKCYTCTTKNIERDL